MNQALIQKNMQSGQGVSTKAVNSVIKQHQDRPVHMKDIYGSKWKSKGKKFLSIIREARKYHKQSGKGIFDDIGDALDEDSIGYGGGFDVGHMQGRGGAVEVTAGFNEGLDTEEAPAGAVDEEDWR